MLSLDFFCWNDLNNYLAFASKEIFNESIRHTIRYFVSLCSEILWLNNNLIFCSCVIIIPCATQTFWIIADYIPIKLWLPILLYFCYINYIIIYRHVYYLTVLFLIVRWIYTRWWEVVPLRFLRTGCFFIFCIFNVQEMVVTVEWSHNHFVTFFRTLDRFVLAVQIVWLTSCREVFLAYLQSCVEEFGVERIAIFLPKKTWL